MIIDRKKSTQLGKILIFLVVFLAISFEYSRIVAPWATVVFLVPIPSMILFLHFLFKENLNLKIRLGVSCGILAFWAEIANLATGASNGPVAWSSLLVGLTSLAYWTLIENDKTLLTPIPIILILYLPRAIGTLSIFGSLLILTMLVGNTVLFTRRTLNELHTFEFFIKTLAFVLSFASFFLYWKSGAERNAIIGSSFFQNFLGRSSLADEEKKSIRTLLASHNLGTQKLFLTFGFVIGMMLFLFFMFLFLQKIRRSIFKTSVTNEFNFGAWSWFVHEIRRYNYPLPLNISPDTFNSEEFELTIKNDHDLLSGFLSGITRISFSRLEEQGEGEDSTSVLDSATKIIDNFRVQMPLKSRLMALLKV